MRASTHPPVMYSDNYGVDGLDGLDYTPKLSCEVLGIAAENDVSGLL